jgi:hypothetical protein
MLERFDAIVDVGYAEKFHRGNAELGEFTLLWGCINYLGCGIIEVMQKTKIILAGKISIGSRGFSSIRG